MEKIMTTEPILIGKVEAKITPEGPSVYGFWYPNTESSTGLAWIGDFSAFEEAEFQSQRMQEPSFLQHLVDHGMIHYPKKGR